jgi:hypothetical protein
MWERIFLQESIHDVLNAAKEKRHDSYIPCASWARGKEFTAEEKELLKKYPWYEPSV